MNKIQSFDNFVRLTWENGRVYDVPQNSIYVSYNDFTVNFILITLPQLSGYSILSSLFSNLEINGSVYETQDEVAHALSSILVAKAGLDYKVVDELPSEGEKGVIYLVPNAEGTHTEYLYVENVGWEQVGTAEVDLSDYYTKDEVDEGNKVNAAAFNTLQKSIGLNENLETLDGKSIQAQIDDIPTQFKTINNESIVGEGNIEIQGGSDNAYEKVSSVTIDDNKIRVFKTDGIDFNNTATTITNTGVTITGIRSGIYIEKVSFDYNKLSYNRLSTNWTLSYQEIKDGIDKANRLPPIVTLTQSEYDALSEKDPNTVYLIKG